MTGSDSIRQPAAADTKLPVSQSQLTMRHASFSIVATGVACVLGALCPPLAWAQSEIQCPPIERRVPPIGIEIPPERESAWLALLDDLRQQLGDSQTHSTADVAVLLKACRFAIEHRELYQEKDFAKVDRLLGLAAERLVSVGHQEPEWQKPAGRQVRGFISAVDGSPQPLGLVLPEGWQTSQGLPLYVWLHGRGDKSTDLHFICERLDKDGQITPPDAIVLHPFGRQCIGFKSAGETDVMEAIEFVCKNYPVNRDRIVLMGFSMGGAGVWHLAAHYGERFVAASPGAGFAETARYQNLRPDRYPPKYEQLLWSIYDVPGYTRNLFNFPVVAYSGEIDKQIQAAQVMEEAFEREGRQLDHLIGPGMGHKYHPDTLQEILQRMEQAADRGRPASPTQLYLQTKHPRYGVHRWLTIDGQVEQYVDTRVDAAVGDAGIWQLETKNVQRLVLDGRRPDAPKGKVMVDGQAIEVAADEPTRLERSGGDWQRVATFASLRKRPGLSGPIDDAFIDPFLIVLPSGTSTNSAVDQWVACELEYLRKRWRTLFRGELRTKLDREVTAEDMRQYHLVLWGTPATNKVLDKLLPAVAERLSWEWDARELSLGERQYEASRHVPLAIFPNPAAPERYVVVNSGPTFRSAHDRTNSLQNPHLPDWAVISLEETPSDERPGKVMAAGFFDDQWELDSQLTWNSSE